MTVRFGASPALPTPMNSCLHLPERPPLRAWLLRSGWLLAILFHLCRPATAATGERSGTHEANSSKPAEITEVKVSAEPATIILRSGEETIRVTYRFINSTAEDVAVVE